MSGGGDEPRTVFEPERTVFEPGPARSASIKEGDVLNHMFAVKRFLARGGMGAHLARHPHDPDSVQQGLLLLSDKPGLNRGWFTNG